MGVHEDLELQEYVQRVGEKLAAVSERPELEWHFTIVDTDDVNAFATMGGYVYISRGILPYFEERGRPRRRARPRDRPHLGAST